MTVRSSTEYVILGTLMPGPKHGYEIMQFLGSALEATWRVGTSQLYVLLKRLEAEGCLASRSEIQSTRPSRRVFRLTDAGRETFVAWLHTPVPAVKNVRLEFLCKLFFFDDLRLPGADALVDRQIRVLEEILAGIRRRAQEGGDRFMMLVHGFKARTVAGLLGWLGEEAHPFAAGIPARVTTPPAGGRAAAGGRVN